MPGPTASAALTPVLRLQTTPSFFFAKELPKSPQCKRGRAQAQQSSHSPGSAGLKPAALPLHCPQLALWLLLALPFAVSAPGTQLAKKYIIAREILKDNFSPGPLRTGEVLDRNIDAIQGTLGAVATPPLA